MPIIEITNLDDQQLDPYRDINLRNLVRYSDRIVVEGKILVHRLLHSEFTTESILSTPKHFEDLASSVPEDVIVYLLSASQIDQLIGFHFHRGVLACGLRPPPKKLSDVVSTKPRQMIVVCPHIVDPTNLGGVIRNCAAFGIDAILLGDQCADPYARRVIRVSMAAALHIPIVESAQLMADLTTLRREMGFELVATVLEADAKHITNATRSDRMVIMFGNEGHGISGDLVSICDQKITLPMDLQTDSLNLATSSGIFLYHFCEILK